MSFDSRLANKSSVKLIYRFLNSFIEDRFIQKIEPFVFVFFLSLSYFASVVFILISNCTQDFSLQKSTQKERMNERKKKQHFQWFSISGTTSTTATTRRRPSVRQSSSIQAKSVMRLEHSSNIGELIWRSVSGFPSQSKFFPLQFTNK